MDGSERNQLEQVLLERRPASVQIANRIDFLLRRTIPEIGNISMFYTILFLFTRVTSLEHFSSLSLSLFHAVRSKYRKIFSLLWVINCLKTTTSYDRAVDYVRMSVYLYIYIYVDFFSFSLKSLG